jgi:basic membrane lipoprotein Med (substrate-binding protein (PBP1-ABC) superfamily)
MTSSVRPIAALAIAIAAAVACACQQGTPGGADAFKVALLTPGPISDGGWNASAYDGLMLIKKELGAEVSNVQTANPAEFEQGFRD